MSVTPEHVLEMWLKHVNGLEVESAASLYDDGSMLLPTFSPHLIFEPGKIKGYFRQLSTRNNLRVELHPGTLRITELGEGKYIATGIYSFRFDVDETSQTFPSRFTFILDVSRKKPIIHHHSSQIPRTLS